MNLPTIVSLLLLALCITSCDQTSTTNSVPEPPNANIFPELESFDNDVAEIWRPIRYDLDKSYTYNTDDDLYAREVLQNLRFKIVQDSISFGRCTELIRSFKWDTDSFRKGHEAVYASLAPKKAEIDILSTYENDVSSCFPLENKAIYRATHDTLVLYDNKHYFYFSTTGGTVPEGKCSSVGVPGDLDNYWRQNCSYAKDLAGSYAATLSRYPHLFRNLPEQLPTSSLQGHYFYIERTGNGGVTITVDVPAGTALARLTPVGDLTKFFFELQYPEVG